MDAWFDQNMIFLACACAGLCITCATYVIIDFMGYTSSRYKERYLKEAAVEMDEVLLQLPPSRILDLSMAISALAIFLSVGAFCFFMSDVSFFKMFLIGVIAAVVTFPLPRLYLRYLRKQRLAKFDDQLEDALHSISSSLKAGFSINQALEVVADENRRPISFEFTVLVQELRLGVPLEEALTKMCGRVESPDFELVAIAIITARQTGGELTTILERLASVIRERVRIMQRVRTLTAQGRLQATIIGAMPFLLLIAMTFIVPEMTQAFLSSIMGLMIVIAGAILVIIGFLTIKKITTIDI